jgi:hypothetical protein
MNDAGSVSTISGSVSWAFKSAGIASTARRSSNVPKSALLEKALKSDAVHHLLIVKFSLILIAVISVSNCSTSSSPATTLTLSLFEDVGRAASRPPLTLLGEISKILS